MKFKLFPFAVPVFLLYSFPLSASTISGSYVSLGAGADITQTQHNTSNFDQNIDIKHKTGFTGYASYGYGFGNGFRLEIEGLYLQSNTKYLLKNHNRNFGGLLDVVYDVDLKRHFDIDVPVTPYVGVSAGYLVNQYNVNSKTRPIHGTQGSFGYGGIAGARFNTPVKNLYANIEYRMIGQTMSGDSYHTGDSRFDNKFNHVLSAGLTYSFGGTLDEPKIQNVVETVPLPNVARTYIVFFDWDKSDLTDSARRIVDHAAQASLSSSNTKILVSGYSDNSMLHVGSKSGERYNLKLSEKRAETVEAELIRQGVSKDEISVEAKGDTVQFVKTGPNTREALNRRVVIVLR